MEVEYQFQPKHRTILSLQPLDQSEAALKFLQLKKRRR